MPLPRRLPPLEDALDNKNVDEVIELKDEDFDTPVYQDEFQEVEEEKENIPAQEPFDLSSYQVNDDEEEPKKEKKKLFGGRKKEKSPNKNKGTNKRKNNVLGPVITVVSLVAVAVILFVGVAMFVKKGNSTSKQEDNKTAVSVKYKREEYGGIVFDVEAKEDTTVNIQRVYKENDGTLVFCETGDIDVVKGTQEGFLECYNATDEVKDTSKKERLVQDNVIVKSEEK